MSNETETGTMRHRIASYLAQVEQYPGDYEVEDGGVYRSADGRRLLQLNPERFLLIERSTFDADHYYLTTFSSVEGASDYRNGQEYPEFWSLVGLLDLDTEEWVEVVERISLVRGDGPEGVLITRGDDCSHESMFSGLVGLVVCVNGDVFAADAFIGDCVPQSFGYEANGMESVTVRRWSEAEGEHGDPIVILFDTVRTIHVY